MDELNPTINYILSESPFHPDDIANLDQLAYQSANSMHRWYLKPLWRLMGVTKFDLYYHYVIWFYERQRYRRTSAGEHGNNGNGDSDADGNVNSNSNSNSGSGSGSGSGSRSNGRRHDDNNDVNNENENESETRDRNQALNILV
ncbi:unnamed protein product [Ambrosiozyma monospora]|uniref:Unnamed protein product n=1 Tax=Ambrosiozyma monospora TaxID=43982 RepID=A0ACB5T8Z7_AMBMO|nr:unnamed protein product [Ambrosiozyma monospora]